MTSEAKVQFSLKEVQDIFSQCILKGGQIDMQKYVEGWQALVRFMNHLGAIFSFISKDADNKISILVKFLDGDEVHYRTIQSMVKYELDNKLVDREVRETHPESGCRTLLRLHRALCWLHLFLERLKDSKEDSHPSVMCSEAYNETLAQHHDWIIQKAAEMAFYILPDRKKFFEVMNAGSPDEVVDMLGKTLPFVKNVYDITEELYADKDLLKLP